MQLIKVAHKYTELVKQELLARRASAVILGFSLEVTTVFKYLKEGAKRMEPGFSHWLTAARPGAMAHTKAQGVPSKHQKTLFTGRVTKHWHRFPRGVMESPSSEVFTRHQSWMAGSRWPVQRWDIGPNNLKRSLPALTILLFSNCIKKIEFDVQVWEFRKLVVMPISAIASDKK